ncbi:MAG: hypothetical protein U0X58_08545 [Flavobacteriaceae bacterium]
MIHQGKFNIVLFKAQSELFGFYNCTKNKNLALKLALCSKQAVVVGKNNQKSQKAKFFKNAP